MPGADRATAEVFFLDSNVLVYSFSGQDAAKREIARSLADAGGACISTQVLSELAHVLTRRFKVPAQEVRARISSIAESCDVVVVTPPVVLDALRIMDKYGYSFFDSQIIAAALASGASILYSEDLHDNHGIDGTLTVRSPFRLRAGQRPKRYRTGNRRTLAETRYG